MNGGFFICHLSFVIWIFHSKLKLMNDSVAQIKEKLDIADFLRGYLNLAPAGKNLKANCPFHKEKTPSFMVSPDRQRWHCFGCGADGDVIGFLMQYENIDFIEALKILGEKTGVDISRTGTQDQRAVNELYEINRSAKEFFKKQLVASPAAIEYLKSRGLKGETAKEFEIGFAAGSPDALSRHLTGAGHSIASVEKAGLVFKTERGTYLDRFRDRIMFPLYSHSGKTVGFTGRIMPGHEGENTGKYVNSPETPIFTKSKVLYGLHLSKGAIRDAQTAVLVEGQMDFIMAWQDGVKNLAATSGTALTIEHLKALRRLADKLVLSFDQDEAGQLATERAIDLAGAADFSVKVMKVPAELKVKDPADIAQGQPGTLQKLAAAAQPAMEYYLDKFSILNFQFSKTNASEAKKNIRLALTKIKMLNSPIERSYWIREISQRTGFSEKDLVEELEGIKVAEPQPQLSHSERLPEAETIPLSRRDLISERISSLVLSYRDFYPEVAPLASHLPESYRDVLAYHFDKRELPAASAPAADLVSLRSGLEAGADPAKVKAELKELLRQLRLENLKDERRKISEEIQLAERKNEDIAPLLARKQKLAEELSRIEIEATKSV